MAILQISSSQRIDGSDSTRLATGLVERVRLARSEAVTAVRKLVKKPRPTLGESALRRLFTCSDQRTNVKAEADRVAVYDVRITEVQSANVMVLAVPMYKLGIPFQLKNWIAAITRARVDFQDTADGPIVLLGWGKAYVVFAQGCRYRGKGADSWFPYLIRIRRFLGLEAVDVDCAEGFAVGAEYD